MVAKGRERPRTRAGDAQFNALSPVSHDFGSFFKLQHHQKESICPIWSCDYPWAQKASCDWQLYTKTDKGISPKKACLICLLRVSGRCQCDHIVKPCTYSFTCEMGKTKYLQGLHSARYCDKCWACKDEQNLREERNFWEMQWIQATCLLISSHTWPKAPDVNSLFILHYTPRKQWLFTDL